MAKKKEKKAKAQVDITGLEERLMARISQLSSDLLGGPTQVTGDIEVHVNGERVAACDANDLTSLDVDATAARMSALAHPVRLRLALAAIDQPLTVTMMIENLGLSTSGQAYHHLRILLQAGWLEGDGTYRLVPSRLPLLQGMVALANQG